MPERDKLVARYLSGVDAIVFDWDDTLIDSKTAKLAQNKSLASHFGVNRSDEEIMALYREGLPLNEMLIKLCGGRVGFNEIWQKVKEDYLKPEFAKRKIVGAEETVRTLGNIGYRTALFTAVSQEALELDAAHAEFDMEVFNTGVEHVAAGKLKSNPESFRPMLARLEEVDVSPDRAVYIADGLGDAEGALNAGMKFVGIEQGFVSADEWRLYNILSLPGVQRLAMIAANITRDV